MLVPDTVLSTMFSHIFYPVRTFFSSLHFTKGVFVMGGCLLISSLLPERAFAASADYAGTVIAVSAPSRLEVGKTSRVTVTLKNTGMATWKPSGSNYTSLYHWDPIRKMETVSPFAMTVWPTNKQPFILRQETKPGESITISFPIQAPIVPGVYHEPYILTAENEAWIKLTPFLLDLVVTPASVATASAPASTSVPTSIAPVTMLSSTEWAGEVVDKGGTEWQIEAEDHVTVEIAFKNTGTRTWTRDGASSISIYAVEATTQKERQSAFKDTRWLSGSHPVLLKENQVLPGEIGHVRFDLRAPKAPGSYRESFLLASENTAWLAGTRVTLPIRVPSRGEFIATAPPEEAMTPIASGTSPSPQTSIRSVGSYKTLLLLRSTKTATLMGNGSLQFTFGFKNTGSSSWSSRGVLSKGLDPAKTGRAYSVRDPSWLSSTDVTTVTGVTKPGEIGLVTFMVKAPSLKGDYTVKFQLNADQGPVEGGEFEIPVTVTQDGYVEPDPVIPIPSPSLLSLPTVDAIPLTGDVQSLPEEPIIRVGLFKTTDDQMLIRAKYGPIVVSENGTTFCRLHTGESTTARYDRTNRVYIMTGTSCNGQSTNYFVFRAEDGISPMEIADFYRPLSWLPGANDNTFRAQLELRYTPATDNVWIINTLPIEYYLKGIAETSDLSPQEFQRTLLVAARTYAMYHVQRGTKHAHEFYTVDATYDQVYRGYGAEARGKNIVAGIDATRGQIVTYQGKLAITPYYSRSDGRTRSWGEVWYGGSKYPWLVSVPVPWDQGKTLWGHGVGMSASGALAMAREGTSYATILGYYYPGTEIRRAYK